MKLLPALIILVFAASSCGSLKYGKKKSKDSPEETNPENPVTEQAVNEKKETPAPAKYVPRPTESSSLECLNSGQLSVEKRFFLVNQIVDIETKKIKAMDAMATFTELSYCKDAPNNFYVNRETNATDPKNLRDAFVCLQNADKEKSSQFHLLRHTTDFTRGIVTSSLYVNSFNSQEECRASFL